MHSLGRALATECATCAPGLVLPLVLPLGLLRCVGGAGRKALSQGELPQHGLRITDHWASSTFALFFFWGRTVERPLPKRATAGHWTLELYWMGPEILITETLCIKLCNKLPQMGEHILTSLCGMGCNRNNQAPICCVGLHYHHR